MKLTRGTAKGEYVNLRGLVPFQPHFTFSIAAVLKAGLFENEVSHPCFNVPVNDRERGQVKGCMRNHQ